MAMCEVVQLTIKCSNLKDEDAFSKSDPFVTILDSKTRREVGRTETVMNNLNPTFTKMIELQYYFETRQEFSVQVWDYDTDNNHELLGHCNFTLGQLMSARNATLTLGLTPKGSITISGLHHGKVDGAIVGLQFRGRQLKNMDTFSKSDPFYVLSLILPSGQDQQLHKSETIDDNLDPLWKAMANINLSVFRDLDAKLLRFQCFDEDVTESESMGEFVCSVNELMAPGAEFRLVNPRNASDFYGYISLANGRLNIRPNFLSLLKQGLQLNIAFSIDFTGSNLEAKNPKSLHYHHPTQPNQYIKAMLAISDVVQEYDTDRQFPAFGFGAILPGEHEASHFFHLNLAPNPYIPGMQAVIDTYVATAQRIRFYGPTNFAPTIRSVTTGARQAPSVYTILLILTDGEISDMDDTIAAMVEADDAPLSILIVGVGQADFSSMERLDGDGQLLRSAGRVSRRDVVQFVPMRDFVNRNGSELAAALLAEIPGQVSRWAEMCPGAIQNLNPPAQ